MTSDKSGSWKRLASLQSSYLENVERDPSVLGCPVQNRRTGVEYETLQSHTDSANGKAPTGTRQGFNCRSAALFGLIAIELFGVAYSARAQTPSLNSIVCSPVTLVTPVSVSCSVNLSAPASAGGATVQLTSSSPALTVPSSIMVEAGQSSAAFSATASAVSTAESAAVTATEGSVQVGTTLVLLSSTSPVQVIAKSSGKCLDVRGVSTSAGATVQQWDCWGGANQAWLFLASGDGSYEVESVNSGLSLNVDGNSSSNGVPIVQWPYSGAANENWSLQPTGNGYYNLVVESTSKCLDVTGGPSSTEDGAALEQWDCWGGDNQAWQLVLQHSVSLTWDASNSAEAVGYYVYRGSTPGGPYTKLSSLLRGVSYVDGNVQAAQTYYYVTTAADSSGDESAYSNEVQAVIPTP